MRERKQHNVTFAHTILCGACVSVSVFVWVKECELNENNNKYREHNARLVLWHVCHNQLRNLYCMDACAFALRLDVYTRLAIQLVPIPISNVTSSL